MCPEIGLLKLSASKYVSNIVLPSPWTKLMWSGRQRNKSTGEKLTKVSTRLRTSLYMINCSFSFVHCLKNKQEQQNTTSDGRKRRLSATAFSVRKLNVTIKKEYLSDCLHFQTRQQFPVPTSIPSQSVTSQQILSLIFYFQRHRDQLAIQLLSKVNET